MKKNSAQTWVIVLAVISMTLTIAIFLTTKYKNKTVVDKTLEQQFINAEKMAVNREPVDVATLTPIQSPKTVTKPNTSIPTGEYAIQIVSLGDQTKAESLLKKITESGLTGYVANADLGEKGTRYRVYVGPYSNLSDAKTALTNIKAIYKDAFVMRVKGF